MDPFIKNLPKAELHVHIEGTLQPEHLLSLAERNKVAIPYQTLDDIKQHYQSFSNYQDFFAAYVIGTSVICTEQDFYDVALAYIKKASEQGVLHTEIFFDIQNYLPRGMHPATIINGIHAGLSAGHQIYGVTSYMILTFLRDLSEKNALESLLQAMPFKDKIVAVGLAATEYGNPPVKFREVFERAKSLGLHRVAHAGEDAGVEYVWQALTALDVERIDHGVCCLDDPHLVNYLVTNNIGITVCPVSNVALRRFNSLKEHPVKKMLDAGLLVSINSDDPALFGSYIADVMEATKNALNLSYNDLITCARNSFTSSFLDRDQKENYIKKLSLYSAQHAHP